MNVQKYIVVTGGLYLLRSVFREVSLMANIRDGDVMCFLLTRAKLGGDNGLDRRYTGFVYPSVITTLPVRFADDRPPRGLCE